MRSLMRVHSWWKGSGVSETRGSGNPEAEFIARGALMSTSDAGECDYGCRKRRDVSTIGRTGRAVSDHMMPMCLRCPQGERVEVGCARLSITAAILGTSACGIAASVPGDHSTGGEVSRHHESNCKLAALHLGPGRLHSDGQDLSGVCGLASSLPFRPKQMRCSGLQSSVT